MSTSLDCMICLTRQSLDAARFATADISVHETVVQRVMELVLESRFKTPAPLIGQKIHQLIRQLTGVADPYAAVKKEFNETMLKRLPQMQTLLNNSADPLDTAVRLVIAGNTIDFALRGDLNQHQVDLAFEKAMSQPINGDMGKFRTLLEKAQTIFYLADNTGEIVCDRVMIEYLTQKLGKKVVLGVRGMPVINDATLEDAKSVGLMEIVPVIDNGNDGLGTVLEQCSQEFLDCFAQSDLIIAKGLANYETLTEMDLPITPKNIAYLFKAKCPFIAGYSGTKLGDLVVRCY